MSPTMLGVRVILNTPFAVGRQKVGTSTAPPSVTTDLMARTMVTTPPSTVPMA